MPPATCTSLISTCSWPAGSCASTLNVALCPGATLHTKAIVVDRHQVLVGSINLDPRSRLSNTEIGLLIDSPQFGATLGALFDVAVQPARAFCVTRSEGPAGTVQLRWTSENAGRPVQYDHDPLASRWTRVLSTLLEALAPEELL